MNNTIAAKLAAYLTDAKNVQGTGGAIAWSNRVQSFLTATLGAEEGKRFAGLKAIMWDEELGLKIGHLEGLLASVESTTSSNVPDPLKPLLPGAALPTRTDSRRVFIVHGHDTAAKDAVARFLERLKLEPIILHEQASGGRTIIEKFETYSEGVAFAVVLLTPDDVGAAAPHAANLKGRARQNVILELGYFIGRLGRTRVCALHKGDVELPSDIQGVLYIELDAVGAWKTQLAQELVQSKVAIELTGLLGA